MIREFAVVLLLTLGTQEPGDGHWAAIEGARQDLRRGLLESAGQQLQKVAAIEAPSLKGHRELLIGNIAFERGDISTAKRHYEVAHSAFLAAGDPQSATIAQSNINMARLRLEREAQLAGELTKLRWLVFTALGAMGLGVLASSMKARQLRI